MAKHKVRSLTTLERAERALAKRKVEAPAQPEERQEPARFSFLPSLND